MSSAPAALRSLQLQLAWPEGLPARALRPWLLQQLTAHGEPLRWAITGISPGDQGQQLLQLHIEAVLLP